MRTQSILHDQLIKEYKRRVTTVKETRGNPENETFYKLDDFIFNYRTLHYNDFYAPRASSECGSDDEDEGQNYQREPYEEHLFCFNIRKGCLEGVSAKHLF